MTYQLRRLRLHGMIQRIPGSHRYRLTVFGLRTGWFFTRAYARILRPGIASTLGDNPTYTSIEDFVTKSGQKQHQEVVRICDGW